MASRRAARAFDVIDVVESAYDLDTEADDAAWLAKVLERFRPTLDQGMGVSAYIVEPEQPIRGVAGIGIVDGWLDALRAMMPTHDPSNILLYPTLAVSTASAAIGPGFEDSPGIRTHWHRYGVADGIGVTASSGSGSHVTFVAPLAKITSLDSRRTHHLERVAGHIAAGWRLRNVIGNPEVAVLDPSGKVVHAEGAAKEQTARDQLREAAKTMDRARGALRRTDDEEALALWRVLVSGEWSLVDRFDSDGRRYLVAHENPPSLRDPRGLSPRELQVLTLTGVGHSVKLMAYELGLTSSVVSSTRRRAMRKLGIGTLAELAQLFPRAG